MTLIVMSDHFCESFIFFYFSYFPVYENYDRRIIYIYAVITITGVTSAKSELL